ncbi:hypothetical protein D3C87_1546150 [compost metagenome]
MNAFALAGQFVAGEGTVTFVVQTQCVARADQRHGPHPGTTSFENARHGVIDLHAGRDVVDAQGNHVGQCLGRPWAAIRHFVGGDHVVGDVTVGGGQFDDFVHDLLGIA